MAFHHHAKDLVGAAGDLVRHAARHVELLLVLFAAVGVAAVDHQCRRQFVCRELLAGCRHAVRVVVGRLAAAQDYMAVAVAVGLHDGDLAILVHRQEVMAARRGLYGVGGNADVAIGAVLESDWRRQA